MDPNPLTVTVATARIAKANKAGSDTLELSAFPSISKDAATVLTTFERGSLSLNGVTSLEAKTAEALAAFRGELYWGTRAFLSMA